jgi:hypothetical protein
MPTFLLIETHTAQDCPRNNERTRTLAMEMADKLEELTKKHGVKSVGHWTVRFEHLAIRVYEAPSFEAFHEFTMEPEIMKWMKYTTTEVKMTLNFKEAMQLIKEAR